MHMYRNNLLKRGDLSSAIFCFENRQYKALITGDKFGYIKEDTHYQYDTWPDAFQCMIEDILEDGRCGSCHLPYDKVQETVQRHREVLACVKEPRLVDFDIWAGNVFLKEDRDGYRISGIIDFERCFFGDPYADFTSAVELFKDVGKEEAFCRGYNHISSVPISLGRKEEIRMDLYRLYMALIWIVEVYRYDDREYTEGVIRFSQSRIKELLGRL